MSATKGVAASLMALAAIAGCGPVEPQRAPLTATPSVAPQRMRTSFSDALSCVDRQFTRVASSQTIVVGGFEDRTKGGGSVGGREMIEAAVVQSSQTSRLWKVRRSAFVEDWNPGGTQAIGVVKPISTEAEPSSDYVLVGSITQFDKGVEQSAEGAGLVFGDLVGAGVRENEQASVLGIDLQLFNSRTGFLVAQSSNSIVLLNRAQSVNARGTINKLGATFDMSFEKQNGIGAAARTLIELGVVELLGKISGVPYWECLSLPGTNPEVRQLIEAWWREMPPDGQEQYLRTRLIAVGYLPAQAGPEAFSAALARFEASVGLIADGRPDWQVYAALLSRAPTDRQAAPAPFLPNPPPPPPATSDPALLAGPALAPMSITSDPRTGLTLTLRAFRGGYLKCFMQLQTGEVLPIYPNPFQATSLVALGASIQIPPNPSKFQIKFTESPDPVTFLCLHSGRDLRRDLPELFDTVPFRTMPGVTLEAVQRKVKAVDPAADVRLVSASPNQVKS